MRLDLPAQMMLFAVVAIAAQIPDAVVAAAVVELHILLPNFQNHFEGIHLWLVVYRSVAAVVVSLQTDPNAELWLQWIPISPVVLVDGRQLAYLVEVLAMVAMNAHYRIACHIVCLDQLELPHDGHAQIQQQAITWEDHNFQWELPVQNLLDRRQWYCIFVHVLSQEQKSQLVVLSRSHQCLMWPKI